MRIINHQKLTNNYYKLIIESKEISESAKPGQFVNIRINPGTCPLLRRPFAIHRVNKKKGTFEILYEIVGPGTKALTFRKKGEKIDIMGPLGNGFTIDNKKKNAILVAGGIGIAPLTYLAEELTQKEKEVCVILGTKTNTCLPAKALSNIGKLLVSTDDGSQGIKGFATDILQNALNTHDPKTTTIYSCGPKIMLKAVAKIAKAKKIECQVSFEEKMACGIGTCLGCATMTRNGIKMVCKDGPVFDAEELIW